ncbi:MAG TPA: DUF5915 domain-containing protein, partial [Candidatus Limnocylindrales bacterium]|nr:DUF5915 domain-containing protein [Candidatus Limnocylindrales bacterium]
AVVGGREELRERAISGWEAFDGHTPHRPWVDAVKIACPGCGEPVERIKDVGNPWLDAGIVPFSTLHYREEPAYWARWFPADFVTESFPGQFRNWFYSMLAMSTVLRREPPFLTLFGYATLFGADGRPMHKSTGNAIEFDEAAERMGVDVMRWMFARARPEENILFGWEAGDAARRELLVLWNVFAFFVTYARLDGWRPTGGSRGDVAWEDAAAGPSATPRVLDRWIRSRLSGTAAGMRVALENFDARTATERLADLIDDLSQWYLRRSRRRFHGTAAPADREAAFTTLHAALATVARLAAPILPFLAEELHQVLVAESGIGPDSVHLTRWPDVDLAGDGEPRLEGAMATVRQAVDLGRTLRSGANLRLRQPLARAWLALPGGVLEPGLPPAEADELLGLLADELNVKAIELVGDESDLVERRVRPLLPRVGPRLGAAVPAVMAAARAGEVEIRADGSVELAGQVLAPDEVEILAEPQPGTAVAHAGGVVVVLDTTLDPALRAEGDARELSRAIQELRKEAGLQLDDRIELVLAAEDGRLERLVPYLDALRADTLADRLEVVALAALSDAGPDPVRAADLTLSGDRVHVELRVPARTASVAGSAPS